MDNNRWPSAVVAMMLIVLVGAITITAIIKYSTVTDALQFWGALTGIVGVLTGAVVTYFLTQGTIATIKEQQLRDQRKADAAMNAISAIAGHVEPTKWAEIKEKEPSVQKVIGIL